MKKLVIKNILILIMVIFTGKSALASVEEIIFDKTQITSKETLQIDTANLIYDTQPAFGNGMYVQIKHMGNNGGGEPEYDVSVPDKYKTENFSNSPMYIYDSNLNLIKSVEFENFISSIYFNNGYFYIYKIIYGDTPRHLMYKSIDLDNLEEISDEEFTLAIHSQDLYNGMMYTWKPYKYTENGVTNETQDRVEYLIDNNRNMYQIVCENNKFIYKKFNIESTNLNVCGHITRSPNDYNNLSNCSKSISLDGVSMQDIPIDSDVENVWNDDIYLYIGKTDDKLHCYRIPIIQLLSCIKIKYNGNYLSFTTPPTIKNDRTLVPMRFLFEQMGADVDWDNATQTAIVKKQGDTISFSINNTEAKVNNTIKIMDVPARLINDKTMIPLRFLSEELGYNVQWDGETRTVMITD